ncbi:hypothetical protein KSP40_PGU013747 [Platanthera guangdongensis]|uniref:Uncharacterized protein n=1 Tax=Platanthera guangdongensis TaxID=2320717 RepID=A0ABR2MBQ4_9ASPA
MSIFSCLHLWMKVSLANFSLLTTLLSKSPLAFSPQITMVPTSFSSSASSSSSAAAAARRQHTHQSYLLTNYLLLGAASGCIFLTLSLRLLPSPCGLLLISLHSLTAIAAATAAAAPASSDRSHAAHTAAAALTAIFQGATALLAFTRTPDFLAELRSYVREDDAAVILKMVGGLCAAIFCLEWVVMALAFALRFGDGDGEDCGKVKHAGNFCPWQLRA